MLGSTLTFAIFLGGCVSPLIEETDKQSSTAFDDLTKLHVVLFYYTEVNDQLPDSIDDLIDFCSDPNLACPQLDWNSFSLQKVGDEKVNLEYKGKEAEFPLRRNR
jgi:hypothetical protein